ncbi:hypothetical protein [Bradyrhizobium sp. SZCCHNR3118]|uniref:hypothetical protein n=1 Tax=Bradyrhizobium sp. SZCCHNR3118 TaxID=3057468 RepID=UPI002915D1C2|nr:hypothetical protein [Bradyrhizobium sp. SZCCHNR3118]
MNAANMRPTIRYKPGFGPNGIRVAQPKAERAKPTAPPKDDTPFIAALKRRCQELRADRDDSEYLRFVEVHDHRNTLLLLYWNDESIELIYREAHRHKNEVRSLLGVRPLEVTVNPRDFGISDLTNLTSLIVAMHHQKVLERAGFHNERNSVSERFNADGTVTFSQYPRD